METELRDFCNSVLNINASAISAFGAGLPGMLGKSAAEQGSITPAADTIYELKKSTADFNRAYKQNDQKAIDDNAKKIEGLQLSLQTQSVIDHNQSEKLINQLHKLAAHG